MGCSVTPGVLLRTGFRNPSTQNSDVRFNPPGGMWPGLEQICAVRNGRKGESGRGKEQEEAAGKQTGKQKGTQKGKQGRSRIEAEEAEAEAKHQINFTIRIARKVPVQGRRSGNTGEKADEAARMRHRQCRVCSTRAPHYTLPRHECCEGEGFLLES